MKNILAGAVVALFVTLSSFAEVTAPLPVALGMQADAAAGLTYSVSASGQPGENLREVLLLVTQVTKTKAATETTTSGVTLRTGKQKTVAQVASLLAKTFQKFLAGQAPGALLGTLGNLAKGGEVEIIAESADILRFDFKSAGQPVSSNRFNRAAVSAFAAILEGK